MAINHYQLLGIPEDADNRRIKAAYRNMAKRFHPDANKGSEAAADLFRQINEAYRILSDARLRKLYNQKIVTTRQATPEQKTTEKKESIAPDPQQKFNRFLNSLLDAIFITPDVTPVKQATKNRAPPAPQPVRKPRKKPDFNFYYYLAMERNNPSYSCGEDGIYRRNKGKTRDPTKNNHFSHIPGSSFVILLLTSLGGLLKL